MMLLIGGAFQGKKKAAAKYCQLDEAQFIDGKICDLEAVYTCKGIVHFHEYIKRALTASVEVKNIPEKLLAANPDIVIVCNELGYGVVPVEKFEREYRETVGRICCDLAEAADEVIRVVCGICTVIKHA